jgi:hypothetical protein
VNLPKQQAVTQLTQSPITAKIMQLQQNGQRISLDRNDGAYVPGLSGTDPNDSSGSMTLPTQTQAAQRGTNYTNDVTPGALLCGKAGEWFEFPEGQQYQFGLSHGFLSGLMMDNYGTW